MPTLICVICGAEASEGPQFGDAIRYECAHCGVYEITGTLSAMLQTRRLNRDESLAFLASERVKNPGAVPQISSTTARYE
ncbi:MULTISPECIES: hypothetical protein [Gammaproteobacteria]|uniref:hypothetical protein n=1 Tax=Gammaproteobacteria TaxID=1236 RepID=UPI001111B621|nr:MULTISPECIES: hypothetical protein [Gammaproteobacteria]EJH4017340.1 hypothetical protein [Vibrio cholerae]EKF9092916.1 hypothetical protein [Vibrio cholerae]ELE5880746.1 hypothetical protein [Vibrio cholerae]ELF5302040.1 hypothetical protein [Vibrio cholerae]MBJ7018399.1 hypothetical protein [Vibrio cholerae]